MNNVKYYIEIKDKKIPVVVRSYCNSNKVKIYFKNEVLNISKPSFLNKNELMKLIHKSEDDIYKEYVKMLSTTNNSRKWVDGESIYYEGKPFKISRIISEENYINVNIDKETQKVYITIPSAFNDENHIKEVVTKLIKQIFKNNTTVVIANRLPNISQTMQIDYSSFKVQDAKTRFGSCVPSKKALHFSSRLIMLPLKVIDAIIVHELAHIKYPNHSKEFYNFVKKYEPDYDRIDRWLKDNSSIIII